MSEDTPEQQQPDEVTTPPAKPGGVPSAGAVRALFSSGRRRALVTAVAFASVIAFFAYATVPVAIDGWGARVRRGTTVADLARDGRLAQLPGDLVSVSGRTLRSGAGAGAGARVGETRLASAAVVGSGMRITSVRGDDVVEPIATKTVETAPDTRFVGHGPVISVEDSGTPGIVEVSLGAISGEETSRRVTSKGTPATMRREPVWPGRREVALTFDDGPWPDTTDAVLAQLEDGDVKATFFMVGRQVNARPGMARRVLAAGMEVGNHSYSHKYLGRYGRKIITREISKGAQVIGARLGARPIWYRPAGGSTNRFVYSEAKRLKMRVVLWTIDPRDWKRPGSRAIARRVLDNVRPGSVILLHDGGGDRAQTVAALGPIIRGLKARGYTMVTLSRLYRLPDPATRP